MCHLHQFVKKRTSGFTLQHMGPKSRPTPKPHAASENKFGKIQSPTPKPWPKRRPLSRSKHPREQMLKQIEPSTIKRHLNGFEKFAQWIHFDHTVSWSTLQPYQLADFLVDTTKQTSDWCYKPILLALTWVSKTFGLPSLLTAIQSPIIQAFLNSKAKSPWT